MNIDPQISTAFARNIRANELFRMTQLRKLRKLVDNELYKQIEPLVSNYYNNLHYQLVDSFQKLLEKEGKNE